MGSSCIEWPSLPLNAALAVTAAATVHRGGIRDFWEEDVPHSPQSYIFYIWSIKYICQRSHSEIKVLFRVEQNGNSSLWVSIAAHSCPARGEEPSCMQAPPAVGERPQFKDKSQAFTAIYEKSCSTKKNKNLQWTKIIWFAFTSIFCFIIYLINLDGFEDVNSSMDKVLH